MTVDIFFVCFLLCPEERVTNNKETKQLRNYTSQQGKRAELQLCARSLSRRLTQTKTTTHKKRADDEQFVLTIVFHIVDMKKSECPLSIKKIWSNYRKGPLKVENASDTPSLDHTVTPTHTQTSTALPQFPNQFLCETRRSHMVVVHSGPLFRSLHLPLLSKADETATGLWGSFLCWLPM